MAMQSGGNTIFFKTKFVYNCECSKIVFRGEKKKSKKGGNDQESIQSSTTPDPGCHVGK